MPVILRGGRHNLSKLKDTRMIDAIKNALGSLRAGGNTVGGLKGRLAALKAGTEKEVKDIHSALDTVESSLKADLATVRSSVVSHTAHLHGLIHGESASPNVGE